MNAADAKTLTFVQTCIKTARRMYAEARHYDRVGLSATACLSRKFAHINMLNARSAHKALQAWRAQA